MGVVRLCSYLDDNDGVNRLSILKLADVAVLRDRYPSSSSSSSFEWVLASHNVDFNVGYDRLEYRR